MPATGTREGYGGRGSGIHEDRKRPHNTINGEVVPERQSLSKALRPKKDN